MITSKDCWLKGVCKKYNNPNKECECRTQDVFCKKLFKVNYLYDEALLTPTQRKRVTLRLDADGTDRDAYNELSLIEKNIKNFVIDGKNLYIHSSTCGNGKTAWATRLVQAYIDDIWIESDLTCRALFINVPRFLLTLKDSITNHSDYIEHIKNNVLSADIVVWDEVGIKNLTTYEHENLLSLINTRLDAGKSNIYTSNLTPDELKEKIGERLYSRVVHLSKNIEFFGQDKRGLE